MKHFKIIFLFIIPFFISCQNDGSNQGSEDKISLDNVSIIHFLFFKKEQKMEIWSTTKNSEITPLKTFESTNCENTPTGIFTINTDQSDLILLEPPNDFYGQKIGEEQFEDIFILKNITKKTNRQSIVISEKKYDTIENIVSSNIKTEAFVFPNDIRQGGAFEPCFGCPHRMAELYSSLELHLNQFKTNTQNN